MLFDLHGGGRCIYIQLMPPGRCLWKQQQHRGYCSTRIRDGIIRATAPQRRQRGGTLSPAVAAAAAVLAATCRTKRIVAAPVRRGLVGGSLHFLPPPSRPRKWEEGQRRGRVVDDWQRGTSGRRTSRPVVEGCIIIIIHFYVTSRARVRSLRVTRGARRHCSGIAA